jgi:hypothetical protein
MKSILSIAVFIMTLISFDTVAQSSNFIGKWETTTAVSFNNNSVARIKISGTEHANYLIITRAEKPKKKVGAKYDESTGRLYTTIKGTQIYFVYDTLTDMLEVRKMNDALICYLTRFN